MMKTPVSSGIEITPPRNRGTTTRVCYSLTAAPPRLAVDNSSWVQFNLNGSAGSASQMNIYSVEITLSEYPQ